MRLAFLQFVTFYHFKFSVTMLFTLGIFNAFRRSLVIFMQQTNQNQIKVSASKSNKKARLSILTQKIFTGLLNKKHGWLFIVLFLPIFGVLAAFNPASGNLSKPFKTKTIVQEIALPPAVININDNEYFWQIDQVRRDDTLGNLFKRMTVKDEDAVKFLMLSPAARAINRQLVPGHSIETKTNLAGKLLHLEYELDAENILVASLNGNGYKVSTEKLALQNTQVLKSATIVNSLFGATDDAGIPDQIALQMIEIFSGEVDFHDDLRPGDKFNVIYEAFYNAGEQMKTGNVLAVEFINRGKVYQAIHFGDAEGKFAYYSPDGKSLHKSFLRTPVEFTRVSSNFNPGRFHPILHRFKSHKGVDLAAPTGTRIKAAGDGVVDFVGKKGGYGNVIVLQHDNGVSTLYGHLSGFAAGLRKGLKVTQSDIIGYVGSTGMATGPHLHYEFLVNKVHRDPLTVALPTSTPLDANLKKQFDAKSLDYMAQIKMLDRSQMATRD
jgi:murein DD-endopeptidase MepM/ murein hydrolase activator NlpD